MILLILWLGAHVDSSHFWIDLVEVEKACGDNTISGVQEVLHDNFIQYF